MLVISCHADTGFMNHSLSILADGRCFGHLDNFVGVYAVMKAYFSGRLDRDYIRLELTYGEETDMEGACEVLETIDEDDVVIVIDVTATATDKDIVIEKCSDSEMDRFIRTALADLPCDIYADCPDPVSTFDETDVYRQKCKKVCFLGVPLTGGDYNEERVECKLSAIDAVCEALCRIVHEYGNYFNV